MLVSAPVALLPAAGLILQLCSSAPLIAGNGSQIAGNERFKWVSRAEELQWDLSRAFDIASGGRLREWMLVERQPDGRSEFDYLVLAPMTLSEFQKRVNDGISKGFRLKRDTLMYRWEPGERWGSGLRVGGVLEKARFSSSFSVPDRNASYEYRVSRWSEKAISKLANEGFLVIDLGEFLDDDGYPETVSLLEKRVDKDVPVAQARPPVQRYKLLTDNRSLEADSRAFMEHLRAGYRLAFVSSNKEAILLEQGWEGSQRPDYLLIRHPSFMEPEERMLPGLERALNDASLSGYRLLPNRIFSGTAGGRWRPFSEYVAIMERLPEPAAPVQYVVLRGLTALNHAVDAGTLREFSIVGTLSSGIVVELPRK
ncbi:MAG TPA: hypothetical protein VGF24_30995 [Vicinamibacterales bacterium]|jgi:hypothetical protein